MGIDNSRAAEGFVEHPENDFVRKWSADETASGQHSEDKVGGARTYRE